MRRTLFYLSVALLAFGIGSFIVINLYQHKETTSIENQIVLPETITKQENMVVLPEIIDKDEQEYCSGLDWDDFFKPAINKWLKGKLTEGKSMRPPKDYRSDGDEFIPSLIDINFDGRKELLIKSNCSPANNCNFTLYQRTKEGYELILINPIQRIQNISLGKSVQKGYRDIKAETKQTDNSGFYSTYKYNGEMYQATECFKYSISKQNIETRELINCYLVKDENDLE